MNNTHVPKFTRSKKDIIVAVRMPRGLVTELRDIQKINHFMDISDEIRFIIRKNGFMPSGTIDQTFAEQKKKDKIIEDLSRVLAELQEKK